MSKDFSYLRHWITGEGYPKDCPPRPVILECVPSRSGLSMGVHDRGERIFTVQGCGFDRIGTALGDFMERLFQAELKAWLGSAAKNSLGVHQWEGVARCVGEVGIESMIRVADAIGLTVHLSETKAGTLIIIQKKG